MFYFLALDKLGFGDYRADAEAVLRDCKAIAAKRRRQSTRLENLGIPEEVLLKQQQELFAKVKGLCPNYDFVKYWYWDYAPLAYVMFLIKFFCNKIGLD